MSFPVAVQSAIFYILACTPCAKVRHRQKAKKQAAREREEKLRIEMEQPHLYRHPDPFNTNPFWSEEIAMGPHLPKKKGKDSSRNPSQSQRELTSAGTQSITTRTSSAAEISNPDASGPSPIPNPKPAEARVDPATPHPTLQPAATRSTPTVVPEDTASEMTEDWNHKRYQREDEELWGHEFSRTGQRLMDAIKHAGSSAGRYMESKLGMAGGERQVTDEDRLNFYTPPEPKNPPVNEYHPPIVRNKPAHKDGYRWMLQPPPSAKVMEGKVPVSRSASMMSTQSKRAAAATAAENNSLGRLVGEKSIEARRRKGEPQARPPYARTRSQRTTRSRSVSGSGGSDVSEGRPASQRRLRATHAAHAMDSSDEEADFPPLSFEASRNPGHAAQRPRLETILSSGLTGKSTSAGLDAVVPANPLREAQNGGGPVPATKEQRPSGASIDSGLALHA